MSWIKLTAGQAAALADLNASNRGNTFILARADADGAQWVCADVLGERDGLCAYYSAWLDGLGVAQQEQPDFPTEC